jgi:hypothetical protein
MPIEWGISLGAIRTYWGRIHLKLGAANRSHVVAVVLRQDFLSEFIATCPSGPADVEANE